MVILHVKLHFYTFSVQTAGACVFLKLYLSTSSLISELLFSVHSNYKKIKFHLFLAKQESGMKKLTENNAY